MLSRPAEGGFTLVELLVGIGLVALLLALGMPSMSTYIQNNKISSAASNYYSGLQLARTEAIRANVPVEFVMTNATGVAAAPSLAGRNWVVRAVPPAPDVPRLIDQKVAIEGEGVGAPAVQINMSVAPVGFDGRITFNGFGAPTDNPYSLDITNPVLGLCAPAGLARCKRINVNSGGQINACDPILVPGSGDSRAC